MQDIAIEDVLRGRALWAIDQGGFGRRFVGVERSADYIALAAERIRVAA